MGKLYFAKTHEWILAEGNKGKVGITNHAQKELGDLVFVELPAIGQKVACGKALCSVESVKAVSEIFSPACGKVIAVNNALNDNPGLINEDAMNAWIAEIEIESLSDKLSETEIV